MIDYLVDHALRNVWCSPEQDQQYIFEPARLTGLRGDTRLVDIGWETISLPDNVNEFHVYQVGQIDPRLLGLTLSRGEWHLLSQVCMNESLVVDLYTNDGRQYPKFSTWVRYTNDRNLILAVRDHRIIGNLGREQLYVRMYSNAYFASDRADPNVDEIHVDGLLATTKQEILLFQRRLRERRAMRGVVNCYRNGYLVDDVPPNRSAVGDVLEFVHDTTVRDVLDFPIKKLETFDSTLDAKRKYLIHPTEKLDSILYRDDVDMFLISPSGSTYGGVWVHKNQDDALRMVTHQDYSVPVSYLAGYVEDHPDWDDLSKLTLRIHRRHSGFERPLGFEHQRIHELYKLDEPKLTEAMLGVSSNVSVWKAAALENSGYTKVMRSLRSEITPKLVQDTYGYNAISKLMGDTPQRTIVEQGQRMVELPYGLRINSTMFEYDSEGELLGTYTHTASDTYWTNHPECRLVEGIAGIGGDSLSTIYGDERMPIDETYSHRMYLCDIVDNEPTWEFWDVTDRPDEEYEIVNGEVVWNIDMTRYYPALKNDKHFLTYTYVISTDDGIIRFSVAAKEQRRYSYAMLPLSIPVGRLELWLNGKALIEGLDYFVRWPEVVVCNKEYLKDGEQLITVRGSGFCNHDMSWEPALDHGFIDHGLLSRNDRFNIRDDKVLRIVVDGLTRHRDDLFFAEDRSSASIPGVRNGAPYVIRDTIVPLRGMAVDDTYELRERSQLVDKEVEDYLTIKYPEPSNNDPNVIPEQHQIFSPFISKIHHDLVSGEFSPEGIDTRYSTLELRRWVADYEYLLEFDPVRNGVDRRYVAVHPHNSYNVSSLSIHQYTFLERVVSEYMDDAVDLTAFIRVT